MNGDLLLFLAAVIGVAGGWLDLVVNPRTRCGTCGGTGRHLLSRKDAYGNCWKCGGTGRRLRRGAKIAARMAGRKL